MILLTFRILVKKFLVEPQASLSTPMKLLPWVQPSRYLAQQRLTFKPVLRLFYFCNGREEYLPATLPMFFSSTLHPFLSALKPSAESSQSSLEETQLFLPRRVRQETKSVSKQGKLLWNKNFPRFSQRRLMVKPRLRSRYSRVSEKWLPTTSSSDSFSW